MNAEELQLHLCEIAACPEAIAWAVGRTAQETWDQCQLAHWLLWWAWRERRRGRNPLPALMRATTIGPRRALQYVPVGEMRPLAVIEAAERWADSPTDSNWRAVAAASLVAATALWGPAPATEQARAAYVAAVAVGTCADAAALMAMAEAACEAGEAAEASVRAAGTAADAEMQVLCLLVREQIVCPV